MMGGQHVLCVAVSALLLAGLSVPQTSAIEPGACENVTECTRCLALAPNCSWFVCQPDHAMTHCANTTTGASDGCHSVNLTDCAVPVSTSTPPPSTTVFPTTTDTPTTEPPTTETPTTEPPTTEPPTTEPPTTEPPTTEPPTTEPPTTEPPTTEPPTTTEMPTTEVPTTTVVPTTVAPEPAPTSPPSPAPRTGGFSFGSFVGGMVFCLVIFAGAFIGLKIYRRRQAMAGRYNNL